MTETTASATPPAWRAAGASSEPIVLHQRSRMIGRRVLRWVTITGTVTMIAVNALANALPINGKTTGDISDGFDILFTPAGYVFSIWGLIYLALVGFTVLQALPSRADDAQLRAVRPWYVLNTLANAGWIFCWHHELFVVSLGVMTVIAGSLVAIYSKLRAAPPQNLADRVLIHAPFSLYLGWISVATFANATVVLATLGLTDAMANPTLTVLLLLVVSVLCAAVSLRFADPIYAAVFVWALVGIGVDNADTPTVFMGALVLAGVCSLVAVFSAFKAVRFARRTASRGSSARA